MDNYKKFYELEIKSAKLRQELQLCNNELNKVLKAIQEQENKPNEAIAADNEVIKNQV